nr:hypothetical protein [Accumulibacter sp.]
MEFVDAECARRVAEKLPDQPVQDLRLAEVVSFEHVAQEHYIDIGPQQLDTVAAIESLRFRKAAVGQVIEQILGKLRALRLGEAFAWFFGFSASVAQHFAKAERGNDRFHGSAAHAAGHFARKQAGGRSGEEKIDVLAVQQSPGKQFPVRDELNFIKEEAGSAGVTPGRVELVEYFDQEIEVLQPQVGETLIFKAEIEQALACRAMRLTVGKNLPEQAGLASPAHTDHRGGLAFDAGQPAITPRQCRQRQGLRIDDLLMNYWTKQTFHEGR